MNSLVEIGLEKSMRGFFLSTYGTFRMDVLVKNIFSGNVDKTERSLYEQNQDKQIKYKHAVDTAVDPMPIGKIPIVRSFISTV